MKRFQEPGARYDWLLFFRVHEQDAWIGSGPEDHVKAKFVHTALIWSFGLHTNSWKNVGSGSVDGKWLLPKVDCPGVILAEWLKMDCLRIKWTSVSKLSLKQDLKEYRDNALLLDPLTSHVETSMSVGCIREAFPLHEAGRQAFASLDWAHLPMNLISHGYWDDPISQPI